MADQPLPTITWTLRKKYGTYVTKGGAPVHSEMVSLLAGEPLPEAVQIAVYPMEVKGSRCGKLHCDVDGFGCPWWSIIIKKNCRTPLYPWQWTAMDMPADGDVVFLTANVLEPTEPTESKDDSDLRVADLIDILSKYDPNLPVLIQRNGPAFLHLLHNDIIQLADVTEIEAHGKFLTGDLRMEDWLEEREEGEMKHSQALVILDKPAQPA